MSNKDSYTREASGIPQPTQKKIILRHRVPFLLPVRGVSFGTRILRLLRGWLWRGWQHWRTTQFIIHPPLQPKRQKPFPQRPHHARRQAVFAALATAPPQTTIKELMAHVRTVTGLGCSRKLIVEWRQKNSGREGERRNQGDKETGRARKTAKRRRLIQQRLFFLCLVICFAFGAWQASLQVGAQEIIVSPAPNDSPPFSTLPSPSSPSIGPRLLRIRLTLQSTRELCIKQGDEVKAGDLLSDRGAARQRLWLQRGVLQMATRHLQTQMKLTAVSLRQLQSLGLALPPTTFAAEQAAIKRAETEALAVQRAVEIQQEKVSGVRNQMSGANLASVPQHLPLDTWHLMVQHEDAKLTQAQDKQLLALSEIELHKAKLLTAREVRAWEEQKHRVEVTRQILAARSQQQQAEIELARLSAQLAELKLQLAQLAEVRAPFAGKIKRLDWEEMNDEKIIVVVYLSMGSR